MVCLQIKNVTLSYESKAVLKDVSLELRRGEMVGIVGRNGSGKSTLIKAISGVLSPWSGEIVLNGQRISRLTRQQLARLVAVVPQNPSLPEAFSALEIVLMGRYPHLGLFGYERQRDLSIVWRALERTGTESLAQRRMSELSGGERQRVIIARALAQEPEIILLDEPTAHLDIQHQLEVMELMQNLVNQGLAAIAAIHDLPLAARFCHRLLLLNNGSVWAGGAPETVITADNLEVAYGINALVYPDPIGNGIVVSPFRKKTRREPRHIHIIGGGGKAASTIQLLSAEGFEVTVGVLNEGDTDLALARTLGLRTVTVPSFATIDEKSHEQNLALVARADCTIVADLPFGQANLSNLKAAGLAKRLILIEETPIEQRDFADGNASVLYHRLRQQAKCTTYQGLLSSVEETLAAMVSRH